MDYEDDSDDDEFLLSDTSALEYYRNYVVKTDDHKNFVLSDP